MRVRNIITVFNLILYVLNAYWFYLMTRGLINWVFFRKDKNKA